MYIYVSMCVCMCMYVYPCKLSTCPLENISMLIGT